MPDPQIGPKIDPQIDSQLVAAELFRDFAARAKGEAQFALHPIRRLDGYWFDWVHVSLSCVIWVFCC